MIALQAKIKTKFCSCRLKNNWKNQGGFYREKKIEIVLGRNLKFKHYEKDVEKGIYMVFWSSFRNVQVKKV